MRKVQGDPYLILCKFYQYDTNLISFNAPVFRAIKITTAMFIADHFYFNKSLKIALVALEARPIENFAHIHGKAATLEAFKGFCAKAAKVRRSFKMHALQPS